MRSLYKTSKQPGRGQFQSLKKIWKFNHMFSPRTKIRGKIVGFLIISGYIGYMIHTLLSPQTGLFRVSLFHLLQ